VRTVVCAGLLALGCTAATAQEAGEGPITADPPATAPEPAPESKTPAFASEDVVIVTATKRAVDIRDIPISIDAFSGEELTAIGATNLESIARYTPGVSVSPGLDPEAAQVIIRGVSTDTFFTFFTRTFGLFYEDVSLVNPSILGPQPNLDPYDMKSVEILKGPQGTLFGGSALAGATGK
jgi:outer membrane receptor protein involved in Fe transport